MKPDPEKPEIASIISRIQVSHSKPNNPRLDGLVGDSFNQQKRPLTAI